MVSRAALSTRIDFVTDTYPDISIKNAERAKRACHGSVKIRITGPKQRCPKQWKKYLSDGENKTGLTTFLLQQWCSDSYAERIGNRTIFFAAGEVCVKIFVVNGKVSSEKVSELACTHEETDTRILLHAKHAADHGQTTVIIRSPDSDVAILACHFQDRISARLLVLKTTKTRTFFLDIPKITEMAGEQLCSALPGLHAFTGCDSTSCFTGKGKKGPLKLCCIDRECCEAMANLGRSFDVDAAVLVGAERFVCRIYGSTQTEVNECRYHLFCSRNQHSHSLPPCQDALTKHTQRANYQAAIWRNALVADGQVPNPDGHGWLVNEDSISVDWMSLSPAPEALLDLIVCGCTGQCITRHCSCHRNSLSCTDACQCGDACSNPFNISQSSESEDSDDGDDDTD